MCNAVLPMRAKESSLYSQSLAVAPAVHLGLSPCRESCPFSHPLQTRFKAAAESVKTFSPSKTVPDAEKLRVYGEARQNRLGAKGILVAPCLLASHLQAPFLCPPTHSAALFKQAVSQEMELGVQLDWLCG